MSTSASKSEFLVISRGQWQRDLPKEKIQEAIEEFYVWLDRLIGEGKMVTGQRLKDEGRTVYAGNRITDGPFGESKEVIGGYWFILAKDLDEAAELISGNPCLNCGLYMELRPTDPEKANAFVKMTETPAD